MLIAVKCGSESHWVEALIVLKKHPLSSCFVLSSSGKLLALNLKNEIDEKLIKHRWGAAYVETNTRVH